MPTEGIDPILQLDLVSAGGTAIILATGYRSDFDSIDIDTVVVCGPSREPDGVSVIYGPCFLGLPWPTRRAFWFI